MPPLAASRLGPYEILATIGAGGMGEVAIKVPPEFLASGAIVPMAVDRIVRRCLEGNPAERFHSAHDLGLALETLSGPGASGQSAAAAAAAGLPATRVRLTPWLLAAVEAPAYNRLTFRRGEIYSARSRPRVPPAFGSKGLRP